MTQNERKLAKQLLDKSREAFVMGLEVFNKPTLRYRVEGFVFFMCNAWELLLKAEIIKRFGMDSIYYKDNIDRTISLSDAIRRIFTNDKDPLRKILKRLSNCGTQVLILLLRSMASYMRHCFRLAY